MNFKIFGSAKSFSATSNLTDEWFFASVNSEMINELVFGLEGSSLARAVLPEAGVVSLFGSAHVLHRQVRHDLVHRPERLPARLLRLGRFRFDPHARVLLLDRLTHVPEKRPRGTRVAGDAAVAGRGRHGASHGAAHRGHGAAHADVVHRVHAVPVAVEMMRGRERIR